MNDKIDKLSEWNKQYTLDVEQRKKLLQDKIERARLFTQIKKKLDNAIKESIE